MKAISLEEYFISDKKYNLLYTYFTYENKLNSTENCLFYCIMRNNISVHYGVNNRRLLNLLKENKRNEHK